METVTTYGEYGQREDGYRASQMLVHDGKAYMVEYVIERKSDPIGTLDVLDIARLWDEFGTGYVERFAIADHVQYAAVEGVARKAIGDALRAAMGIHWQI